MVKRAMRIVDVRCYVNNDANADATIPLLGNHSGLIGASFVL